MRFAHVTTFYPPYSFGGDGIVVQRFARALARRGHDVTVVHDVDTFQILGGQVDSGAGGASGVTEGHGEDGVRVIRVQGRPRTLSSLLTHQLGRPVLTARALREILTGPFDVVHFHNVSMVGGPGILAYGGDALKLYTAHEHWLVCPTHVLWKFGREPCDSRACVRCSLSYRRPLQLYRYTGYMQRQLAHVDVFFAQTEFSRKKHADFGFEPPMEILSPFLPDLALPPTPGGASPAAPLPDARPYVLFAGRLERMKGLDDIVHAFRDDAPADLVIAGEGDHRTELERLAGGCSAVHFLGQVPNNDVHALMAKALAVLVPTEGYETFGFTVLEAFRAGVPVIARRRGPLPELVERSNGGILFDSGKEAVSAIRSLLDDPSRRSRLGRAGREAFEAKWSEDIVIPKYLERIRSLELERRERRSKALS